MEYRGVLQLKNSMTELEKQYEEEAAGSYVYEVDKKYV